MCRYLALSLCLAASTTYAKKPAKPVAKPATKTTPKAPKDALLAAADEIARQVRGCAGSA